MSEKRAKFIVVTNPVYIKIREGKSAQTGEIATGVNADWDKDNNLIGIELLCNAEIHPLGVKRAK